MEKTVTIETRRLGTFGIVAIVDDTRQTLAEYISDEEKFVRANDRTAKRDVYAYVIRCN